MYKSRAFGWTATVARNAAATRSNRRDRWPVPMSPKTGAESGIPNLALASVAVIATTGMFVPDRDHTGWQIYNGLLHLSIPSMGTETQGVRVAGDSGRLRFLVDLHKARFP